MQNFILSLEGAFPSIYSQSKLLNSSANVNVNVNPPLSIVSQTNSNLNVSLNLNNSNPSSSITSSLSHSSSASSLSHPGPLSSTNTDEILPNKLPLKRRLVEFRYGRDGGSLILGKKSSVNSGNLLIIFIVVIVVIIIIILSCYNLICLVTTTSFTTNPFAFDKFKDISPALTVHLHEDGVILEPGGVGLLSYSHPTILSLLNSINNCTLPPELFIALFELTHSHSSTGQSIFYDSCVVVGIADWRTEMTLTIGGNLGSARPVSNFSITTNNSQWARRVPPFNSKHL